MVLTARRADKLAEVTEKCRAAHIKLAETKEIRHVVAIEADMTKKSDIERLIGKIGGRIDMYVLVK